MTKKTSSTTSPTNIQYNGYDFSYSLSLLIGHYQGVVRMERKTGLKTDNF
jgi:hypothetical protein